MDVYVNEVLIIGGVICENKNRIVHSLYLGFIGDLAFFDTQGTDDPDYTGMGARWILIYLAPGDIVWPTQPLVDTPPFVPLPIPPLAPTGFIATPAFEKNTLTWDTVANMTYNLYWSTVPGVTTSTGTKIAGVASGYVHAGLADNTTYYYVLEVNDAYGNSALSSEVSGLTLPAAPTGFSALGGYEQITLSWSPTPGLLYNIYYATTPGVTVGTGTKITGPLEPYILPGLPDGISYYFIATAVNATGEGPTCAEVNASTYATPTTWTWRADPTDPSGPGNGLGIFFSSIAYSAALGTWVASGAGSISNSTKNTINSPDGITWNLQISAQPLTSLYTYVARSDSLGLFVAINGGYSYTSPDGINWTQHSIPSGTSISPNSLIWVDALGLFVCVGSPVTTGTIITSPDGINWTNRAAPSAAQWQSVAWSTALGLLVAVASTGTNVAVSSDGINWNLSSGSVPANIWKAVTWNSDAGQFVAVAFNATSNTAMTSVDGNNWVPNAGPGNYYWNSIAYGDHWCVAVGSTASAISPDGTTWTMITALNGNWKTVEFGNHLFVAGGGSSSDYKLMSMPS